MTASKLRLIWWLIAVTSRQARCSGWPCCRQRPPAASKIRSIAVLASFAINDWVRLLRSRIGHRRFAIVPNLEFCGVDRVLRDQPAGVDARRRLTDALLDSLEVGNLLAAEHDGSVSLAHLVLVDEAF